MNLPFFRSRQKPLRMVWQVQKHNRTSYLVGTAHFFPYSFARSLTRLVRRVDTAIFEGPLDEASSACIAQHGRQGDHTPSLVDALDPAAVAEINRQLRRQLEHRDGNSLHHVLQPARPNYFEMYTRGVRPWAAYFAIWQTCMNWNYSVDMEGFRIARRLGKNIHFLETIEEQLAVLEGISFERIVRYLNQVHQWPDYAADYVKLFLEGDVDRLLELMDRFMGYRRPAVSSRDAVLFERVQTLFSRETGAAFVGFPHIPGIRRLFLEAGYHVTQGVE